MPTGSTIVEQSATARNGLFAFLELMFLLAFARGVPGAATTAGRIAAGLFCGGALVGISLMWWQVSRRRSSLDISDDAIALVVKGVATSKTIERRDGDHLRFVLRGNYRARNLGLVQDGTESTLMLPLFNRKPIEAACRAHGWRFDGSR